MTPFTKILVPTDFSEGAEAALRIASDLSFRFAIPMTLVYVFEPSDYPLPNGYVIFTSQQCQQLSEQIEQHLGRARRSALDAGGAHSVTTRLLQGWAADQITQFAKDGSFDLIVMGTHGRSGLKHMLVGSVAERVVRTAPCPVLTVRKPEKA